MSLASRVRAPRRWPTSPITPAAKRRNHSFGRIVNDVLVLNFTYEALNITTFQRAVKLIFSGKAEVLHGRDHRLVSNTIILRCGCPR